MVGRDVPICLMATIWDVRLSMLQDKGDSGTRVSACKGRAGADMTDAGECESRKGTTRTTRRQR